MFSSKPRPHFTPGKDLVPILQEAGWATGPVWTGGKSRPHQDSIPDRPARSQSLYRLSYPAHKIRHGMLKRARTRGEIPHIYLNIPTEKNPTQCTDRKYNYNFTCSLGFVVCARAKFNFFSILCLTRDFIHQGHAPYPSHRK